MNWNTQRGGPWGGGGGHGPWGGGPSGRPTPPDLEEMLRRSQDRVKRLLPSGGGGWKRIALLGVAALVIWFATGFYRVEPEELGIELLFGKFHERTQPGLNWNFPSPVGQVFTPKVTRINAVQVGVRNDGGVRRSTGGRAGQEESLMLTGDENIIDIQFVTFWTIKDAQKFTLAIRNPEATVKAASEAAMREIIGRTDFEYAYTGGRSDIQQDARKLIQQLLDSYNSGIEVTDVNLQQVQPPEDKVIDAFSDVQRAQTDKQTAINQATAYQNEVVQNAEGDAAKIKNEADAYKQEKIALATGDASRFLSVLEQYKKDKDVTRRRIYLETMRGVMSGMDKVLIDNTAGNGVVPYLPLPELQPNKKKPATSAPAPAPAAANQPGARR